MKMTANPVKRTGNTRAPHRKLLATLTAAALLAMAGAPHALAAPPVTLQFAPVGDSAHPDELAFDIPLAAGESVADIRYLANGAEFSLMDAFEWTPGTGGVTATYLPKLDFNAFLGQTIVLKVVKAGAAFSAQSEEQLLLKIVSARDLQQDLKLVAVTDGTSQADALEFVISGAVNAALSDLLLVSAKGDNSVKALLTLGIGRGGDISASLRDADLDTFADKPLELRAVKTLKGSSATLTQKFTLALTPARAFTQDATLTVPTSGDKQPDPFTLDLATGANVEVKDITLDQPGGAVSVLDLFTLTRAVDGDLSAKLKTDLDFDPYLGQA